MEKNKFLTKREIETTVGKCLLNVNHIRGCGDYGYEADIDEVKT